MDIRIAVLIVGVAVARSDAAETVDYEKQVKPILTTRCVACHGVFKQAAGLRLDTAAFARQGGESGAAVKPGDASGSPLFSRVTSSDPDQRMPQEGEPLKAEQIEILRRWIEQGANAPDGEKPEADPRDHWSFRPIRRPDVPAAAIPGWGRTPLDAFVARQLAQHRLRPQREATRTELIRRLYLDLLGLPPDAQEWRRLDEDQAEGWYERLVQRLLDDPRHGERWARHWMDIWRYSDWWGLGEQLRNSQMHIWHWRDWIVESLNADLPYDEMVRQMLAADELYPEDLSKLRATGYLARNYFLFNRNQWMDETIEHMSKSFMGLTANCAKCHDHKYDPLDQTDYYRMRAIFEPYHVRLDMAPGEADFTRDAIPRVFDGRLDTPTYRFIRGQEANPDRSQVLQPGVPALLAFDDWKPTPVELPSSAWQPERRPWVVKALQAAAEKQVANAEAALKPAQDKLTQARKRLEELKAMPVKPDEPTEIDAALSLQDAFEKRDDERWQVFGGEWKFEPGRVQQLQDGPTRAGLRLRRSVPEDFDATVRFTIVGGSKWRSVSFVFDSTQADPTQPLDDTTTEQTVYVSGVQGGSKVQAAYGRGGKWNYPTDGMVARRIELNREYTLRVQVRGTLVNASLNGEPVLAWRSPQSRAPGAMQLTTFDALAVFHEFRVAPLAKTAELREPSTVPRPVMTVEVAERATKDAETELQLAERNVEVARAELASLEARAAHLQTSATTSDDARRTLHAAAVTAERRSELAKARRQVTLAEQKRLRAATDKVEAADKEVATANESLQKAQMQLDAPPTEADKLAPLVGARWTPTRFLNSGADDPAVTFSSQSTGRRTALARWLTDRRHPLTARVAVNHVWSRHLGMPLVATVFDFGRKGAAPTNPELLDWLAAEFQESGWSFKHLHRTIVLSSTYRLSSSALGREEEERADPESVQGWRRTAIRVESQVVRDSLLSLAGTLDATRGGPPIAAKDQAASQRRSLYFFHSNNERNLFLTTFDEATVKECYRREQSVVPQQALALTNSQLVLDLAPRIAQRLRDSLPAESARDDDAFVRVAFRSLVAIDAGPAELQAAREAFQAWRAAPAAERADPYAWFVWSLINHNDFVTLR